MVHRVVVLLSSIPRERGVHQILSLGKIIIGKRSHLPELCIGQYVQGMTGGSNGIEKERSIDTL